MAGKCMQRYNCSRHRIEWHKHNDIDSRECVAEAIRESWQRCVTARAWKKNKYLGDPISR